MRIDYKSYKHFSFDLWLTLIKSNPEFKRRRNILFRDFFELDCSIERVTEVVRYYDVLCNNINENTGSNIDTSEIYYLILNALQPEKVMMEIELLDQFYIQCELLFMEYKPSLIHSNTEVVFKEILRQEKTANILSNTGFIKGISMRKLMSYYGFDDYFLFQIYSDEVGISKPNTEIFKLSYDQILLNKNIEPKDVLHIGDNELADFNGAVNFGFDAQLLRYKSV